MADTAESIGDRLFKIRAACGRGERDPESLERFAERVLEATGRKYDPVTISNLERGKRRWLLADVETFAAVDPLKRGREWLAGWVDANPTSASIPMRPHGEIIAGGPLEEKETPAKRVAGGRRKPRNRGGAA